jgi:hypothetical protein
MNLKNITTAIITFNLFIPTLLSAASNNESILNKNGSVIQDGKSLINFDNGELIKELYNDKTTIINNNKVKAINSIEAQSASGVISKQWGLYKFGSGIGFSGFYTANLDGIDGVELVFASGSGFGSNKSISILGKSTDGYEIINQEELPNNGSISSLTAIYDSSSDNHLLFIASQSGTIHIYNLSANRWLDDLADINVNKLFTYDIDSNGTKELVAVGDNETKIFDIATRTLKYTYDFGGDNAVIGNFSAPDSIDIVLNQGEVYSIDGADNELVWSYNEGFGYFLDAVDSNNDGVEELITAQYWYELKAFNIEEKSELWSHSSSHDIDALYVYDTNGDGSKEVLYGDGQWGDIYALDSSNGEVLWQIDNPSHGVTQIMVADLDNDEKLEIFWGSGYSSTGSDHLYVHDLETKEHEWTSVDLSGSFYAYKFGDVDNDGTDEIIAISDSSNSSYDDGIVYVFDSTTFELEWSTQESTPFGGFAWTGIHDLEVADINNDGKNEILVATDRLYDGALYVLNGIDGSLLYSKIYDSGSPLYAIKAYDINNDGDVEIIASSGKAHTGSPGKYIYIINGTDGEVEQKSPSLNQSWTNLDQIELFDFTQDGLMDVVVADYGNVSVYDVKENKLLKGNTNDIVDVSYGVSDNSVEVIAVNNSEQLVSFDEDFTESVIGNNICDSSVNNISRLNNSKMFFSCSEEFGLFDLTNKEVEWSQTTSSTPWAVQARDIDSTIQILVGGDTLSVYKVTQDSENIIALSQSLTSHAKASLDGVLTTDSSLDNKNHFVVSSPLYGSIEFTDRTTGAFTYTPHGDFVGEDNFSFIVISDGIESNEAIIEIELTNQVPTSINQNYTLHWSGMSSEILYAEDLDNDSLLFELINSTHTGQLNLVDSTTGEFTYTPEGNSLEPVTFDFTVSDGLQKTESYSVILNFHNTVPIAQDMSVETYYSTKLSSRFEAIDSDDDTLTYELVSSPNKGTFSFDSTHGLFEYEPVGEDSYDTSIEFKVFDGIEYSTVHTVSIKVVGKAGYVEDSSNGGGVSIISIISLLILSKYRMLLRRRKQRRFLDENFKVTL